MSQTQANPDFAGQQKAAAAFMGSFFGSGADPLLKAQADLLVSFQSTMTDWLHRRHEAVVDTQRLMARLRTASDPAELWQVQQEWASGVFQRLAADAAACQSATMQSLDKLAAKPAGNRRGHQRRGKGRQREPGGTDRGAEGRRVAAGARRRSGKPSPSLRCKLPGERTPASPGGRFRVLRKQSAPVRQAIGEAETS